MLAGRQIIDRTGNGRRRGIGRLAQRLRISRPKVHHVSAGRFFVAKGPSGTLIAQLLDAPANGPAGGVLRCEITMESPAPDTFGTISVAAEWLGIEEAVWPEDAEEVAERLAMLGRLLTAGDLIGAATQVGKAGAQVVTYDERKMLAAYYVADMSLRSTVMPEGSSLLVVVKGARPLGTVRYDAMEGSLPGTVENILRSMPMSAILDMQGSMLMVDPVCHRLHGTQDIVEAMRNIGAIEDRFGRLAHAIVMR